MKLIYKIEQKNCTLNNILQNNLKISSRLLYKLIKNNCISLNEKDCDTRNIVIPNDILSINFDYEEDNSNIVPIKMDLKIVFEDDWLLIVNKPAGIATHPSVLHFSDSLCNPKNISCDNADIHYSQCFHAALSHFYSLPVQAAHKYSL